MIEETAKIIRILTSWAPSPRLKYRRRTSYTEKNQAVPDIPEDQAENQPYNHTNVNNVNVNRNVNVTGGGWGPYYGGGGGWGGVAAGAAAGLAVGTVIGALSANAQQMVVNNQTYYYDGGNYYQPCYQGTDSSYCVVADPNE